MHAHEQRQAASGSSRLGFPADGGPRRISDDNTYFVGTKKQQYRSVCGKCGARRIDQQIGLEETPEAYVAKLVEVFREVRRVLRDDGTLWLNLGDSFSSGVGANVNDLLAQSIEESVIFLSAGCTLTITTKSDGVLKHNKLTPNEKFTPLFGVKRVFVKDRNNDLRQIFDSFTSIGCNWISASVMWATIGQSNSDIVLDMVNDLKIVISEHDLNTDAPFKVSILSSPTENGKAAFAIKESGEPIAKSIGDGKPNRDAIMGNAFGESLSQVDAIDDSVSFGNASVSRASHRGNLRITKASSQQFFFSLEDGRCDIAVLAVGHLFVSNRFGSFIRYTELYDQTIRKANALQSKQELGIPDLVKRALMEDGWICRQTIIWHKLAPMPESVQDRPTKAHEQLFLLAKSPHYYYDGDAIREPNKREWSARENGGLGANGGSGWYSASQSVGGGRQSGKGKPVLPNPAGANRRSVWTLGPESYSGAHFAVMPTKLVEPCILAGTSAHGCCAACGAPWERVVEREGETTTEKRKRLDYSNKRGNGGAMVRQNLDYGGGHGNNTRAITTLGWQPTCQCQAEVIPCTVLDPFCGSGTTLAVALKFGRRAIGIDLDERNMALAHDRIARMQPMLFEVTA